VERSIKEADDRIKTFRALAQATLINKEDEHQTDVVLVIVRPNHIRVDAMDNLADVWASAGTDGSRLWLWLPHKEKLYRGAATQRNLKRLADFEWELSEVSSIAAGLIPDARNAELVELSRKEGHYRMTDKPIHLWVDPKTRHPIRLVKYSAPERESENPQDESLIQYEVKFAQYESLSGEAFPREIDVTFPGHSCSLSLRYREVEFNAKTDPQLFKPETVWHSKTVEMDK
jgi:outer membrane lipoprotein-sorting protein